LPGQAGSTSASVRELTERAISTWSAGKGQPGVFKTECAIARPEDRALLKRELAQAECLGRTADGKIIYLWQRSGRKMRRCCVSWAACAKLLSRGW
jgi:hypothetical protein